MFRARVFAALALVFIAGPTACANADQGQPDMASGELPPNHPPVGAAAAAAPAGPSTTQDVAVIKETMDSGGYTYALVEVNGEEIWLAGPATELTVGEFVAVSGGMVMENFTSSSLGRTFDTIYFVDTFFPLTADEVEAMRTEAVVAADYSGTVLQAHTTAGYTYAEVETADGVVWLAGPMVQVSEGQTVTWPEGMLMRDFKSDTLDRTFDEIFFVDQLTVVR
jgi:hypothetical protein